MNTLPCNEKPSTDLNTVATSSNTYLQSWRPTTIIVLLCLGTFLVSVDPDLIMVAVPKVNSNVNSSG